jgi:predicted lipid-binding transport protein (Tim44 family)
MTGTASPSADNKAPSFDRRVAFAFLGMACGLAMGLLLWCFDLLFGTHHAVITITLSLMLLEAVIGAVVAQQDKGKLDDLLSFIIAFFIVP